MIVYGSHMLPNLISIAYYIQYKVSCKMHIADLGHFLDEHGFKLHAFVLFNNNIRSAPKSPLTYRNIREAATVH